MSSRGGTWDESWWTTGDGSGKLEGLEGIEAADVEQIERGITLSERSTGVTGRPEGLATSRIIE